MAEDNRQNGPHDAAAMSLDRLRLILDAYGARPDLWPERERASALALLAGSEGARRLQDEAAGLDTLIDDIRPPLPSDALAHRLMDVAPVVAESSAPAMPFWQRIWGVPELRPAAVAAAMLLAFIFGLLMPSPFRGAAEEVARPPVVASDVTPDVDALPLVDDDLQEADAEETVLASIPLH